MGGDNRREMSVCPDIRMSTNNGKLHWNASEVRQTGEPINCGNLREYSVDLRDFVPIYEGTIDSTFFKTLSIQMSVCVSGCPNVLQSCFFLPDGLAFSKNTKLGHYSNPRFLFSVCLSEYPDFRMSAKQRTEFFKSLES